MSEEFVCLKRNVMAEPLFDRWYAWSHLISPATASRNITERHLRIMDSYIAAIAGTKVCTPSGCSARSKLSWKIS